ASLDELYTPNSFFLNVWQTYYGNKNWQHPNGMSTSYSNNYHYEWNAYVYYPYRYLPQLNYHGWSSYYYGGYYYGRYDYYDSDMGGSYAITEDAEMDGNMPVEAEEVMDELAVSKSQDNRSRNGKDGTTLTTGANQPIGGS